MKKHTLFPFFRWRMCDRLLAMSLATALGLAGCSTDDDRMAGDSLPEGKYPMTFTATVEGQRITKAGTRATWDGGEEVAVMAGNTVKKYTAANNGVLTPTDAGDKLYWTSKVMTVRAWYSPTYSDQQPTGFTVAKDQSSDKGYQASDFLYTSQTFTFSKNASSQLVFKHLPAKVVINLKAGGEITENDVKNATVTLVNQLLTGTMNENGVMTHASQGADEITPHDAPVASGYQRTLQALLVPQQMKDKEFIKVTIGADRGYYYIPTTETDGKLEAGNQYTYNITVKKEKLVVTASSSVSWEKVEETTGNAQETPLRINYEEGMTLTVVGKGELTDDGEGVKILSGGNLLKVKVKKQGGKFLKGISVGSKYYTIQSWEVIDDNYEIIYQLKSDVTLTTTGLFVESPTLKTGSFYYADGEWSEELWDKPCIGIVFKVNRDKTDKNNYTPPLSVRGYVVALQDAPGEYRRAFGDDVNISSLPTSTTDFNGYAVCQSMKEQSGFSPDTHWACYSALNYTPKAPTASSGWYLPSLGEWNALWQNYGTVQKKFATAGGSDMKKNWGFYWSMSRKRDDKDGSFKPAFVDFGAWSSGTLFPKGIRTDETEALTRPILTF